MIIKNMQPAMYKSLTDMVDDNSMMDLSQYFRLGKIFSKLQSNSWNTRPISILAKNLNDVLDREPMIQGSP